MGINVSHATSQANRIRDYASKLRDIRNSMNIYKGNLNGDWQAEEMHYVNRIIDKINNEISRLSSDLDSLGRDIITTAHEIRREEEAREAAARAAAAART